MQFISIENEQYIHFIYLRIGKLIENCPKIKKDFGNNLINGTKKESLGEMEQNFINDFQYFQAVGCQEN